MSEYNSGYHSMSESIYQLYCMNKIGSYSAGKYARTPHYFDRMGEKEKVECAKELTEAQAGMTRLGILVCVQACVELAARYFVIEQWYEQKQRAIDNPEDLREELYYFLFGHTSSPTLTAGVHYWNNNARKRGTRTTGWTIDKDSAELYDSDWLYNNENSPWTFFIDNVHLLYGSSQRPTWWLRMADKLAKGFKQDYENNPKKKLDIDSYVRTKETKQFNGGINNGYRF